MFKWYPPNETAVNVFFDVESDLIVKKPMVFIIENPQLMFFKWYFPNETAELRGLLIQGWHHFWCWKSMVCITIILIELLNIHDDDDDDDDDGWWFMMIYDDLWWFMMIYDDLCFHESQPLG